MANPAAPPAAALAEESEAAPAPLQPATALRDILRSLRKDCRNS
jgi:hypothetical protein